MIQFAVDVLPVTEGHEVLIEGMIVPKVYKKIVVKYSLVMSGNNPSVAQSGLYLKISSYNTPQENYYIYTSRQRPCGTRGVFIRNWKRRHCVALYFEYSRV